MSDMVDDKSDPKDGILTTTSTLLCLVAKVCYASHNPPTMPLIDRHEKRTNLLLLLKLSGALLTGLLLRLALLQERLWDEDLLLSWDGTAYLISLCPGSYMNRVPSEELQL